ncbi:UDP-forming cellulose synthase catalytic subunit [Jiella flava]|nr:UDP-forming cellulose synthase catalytic subunit [Jiella flava]
MVPVAWLLSLLGLGIAVAQPVGTNSQVLIAATLVAGMLVLWMSGPRSNERRLLLMALALAAIGRYAYWRTVSTLPDSSDLANFIPGVALYAVEMFAMVILLLSLFVVLKPKSRPARATMAGPASDAALPTVDVFVPTYNESAELLTVTLAAAISMDYPADKLTVYLLDDGGTDEKRLSADPVVAHEANLRQRMLTKLCDELGAVYLAREKNVSAKAGNLNAALPRTSGDLIAVFDADHAPVRDFLRKTVHHFAEDAKLFLVQTPHFFLNPDPIEKNLGLFKRMPSENEMFYGVVQRGLDSWGAAYFCGSAAVLRRTALETVGGFSGTSITEDCETALTLHGRGWRSRYVDQPLIAGLQPETFGSFIGQRSRWCQGMLQIMLLKNPLFVRGLTMAQRICYLSSGLFWLFPFMRLTFMVAPLLFIFFDLRIYQASLQEFLAYTCTYMLANVMLQNYLYGDVRWPWISELYEYVQSIYLIRAIAAVIRNPRSPIFAVTAKGALIEQDRLSTLARPYLMFFCVLLVATLWCAARWYLEPTSRDLLLALGGWNVLNLVVAGLALGVVTERAERRRNQRLSISRKGALNIGETAIDVVVEDVSSSGVRIRPLGLETAKLPKAASIGTLTLDGSRQAGLAVVVRRRIPDARGICLGLEFMALAPSQMRTVADLMYADASALSSFRESRRKSVGVVGGSLNVIRWSIESSVRALGHAARRPEPATPITAANDAGTAGNAPSSIDSPPRDAISAA